MIKESSHLLAMMFLIAVGFWNFLGAGVIWILINTHSQLLRTCHLSDVQFYCHAALMGVYGMSLVAANVCFVPALMTEDVWSNKLAAISFWGLNGRILLLILYSIFPAGVIQTDCEATAWIWYARSP